MSHREIFTKLHKLWDHLGLPDEGPNFEITARSHDKTFQFIEEGKTNKKKMYGPTVKKWAYALASHYRNNEQHLASQWLLDIDRIHKEQEKSKTLIQFGLGKHNFCEVTDMLVNHSPHFSNKKSPAKRSEPLTYAEFAWFHLLQDQFSLKYFDFLFGLSSELPNVENVIIPTDDAIREKEIFSTDDLQMIKSRWFSTFESTPQTIQRMEGYYLFYRWDDKGARLFQEDDDAASQWFLCQKVQVIPVTITEQNSLLKWEDFYPDVDTIVFQTFGLVVEQQDGSFEIHGLDREQNNREKYFGKFSALQQNETSRGVILAKMFNSQKLESYPIWLRKVSQDRYKDVMKRAYEFVDYFKDNSISKKEKYRDFINDDLLLSDVSSLLEAHRYQLVKHLFSPYEVSAEDLRKEDVVSKIRPWSVQRPLEIPWN
ncbi:MAG: hypothetical protein ACRBBN_04690 [Methyloligellaceae bacterium]